MKFTKRVDDFFKSFKLELTTHLPHYLFLSIILIYAFWIRVYRNGELMAFYYDQGRDALVIWKLWHEHKFFLIGPITGLTGIFLGPFFYYIIAPFYLIGGGNPVVPACFLALLSVLAILIAYYLGSQIVDRNTGLIAAIISSFSFNTILSGRWLSNPTPILFSSMVVILSMWKIIKKENLNFWWPTLAFFVAISMHFESASAVFYIPILFIFYLLQVKTLNNSKTYLFTIFLFVIPFLPQVLFDVRHDNIMLKNFIAQFSGGDGFRFDFWQVLVTRLNYFLDVFGNKILPQYNFIALFYLVFSILAFYSYQKKSDDFNALKLLCVFLFVPLIGYTFYQGNHGNIYDYYLTGYFMPFILLFSLGLGVLWKNTFGKVLVLIFFTGFFYRNIFLTRIYMSAGIDGPTHITLGNEIDAVNWIYKDISKPDAFNVDVYVPPVIPYSYDYLLLWQGTKICGSELCGKVDEIEPIVYVIYEVDPPHPERLENWMGKYENSSKIIKSESFGGITVEKRERL